MNTLCYIDPASTALIWQVLAGIFISLGVVLGVFWRKISTFFKSVWVKLFKKNKAETEEKVVDESALEVEDELDEKSETKEPTNEKTEEASNEQNDKKENE